MSITTVTPYRVGNWALIEGEKWMKVPKPLSDEAICEILLKKEWKGFVELVRQIERLHGIGVE